MDQMIQQSLVNAASELENQLDGELNALDAMTGSELQALRNQRLNEMKNLAKKKQEWLNNGHGAYEELSGEKEFFEVSKKSANIVAHFYRDATERCKIVDHHLKILAKQHLEAKFCKVNAENSPFLTQRLRIKVIPTIAIIKDSKTKDYIVGFTDLGNRDDFSTEMMEWRIAQSGAIEYNVSMLPFRHHSRVSHTFIIVFLRRATCWLRPIKRAKRKTCSDSKRRKFAAPSNQTIQISILMIDRMFRATFYVGRDLHLVRSASQTQTTHNLLRRKKKKTNETHSHT